MKSILDERYVVAKHSLEKLSEYKVHRRLRVFFEKGVKCSNPECNREGAMLVETKYPRGGRHMDVYADDGILMSVDHFIPKYYGGTNHILNLFPMCNVCNTEKAHVMPDISHISADDLALMKDESYVHVPRKRNTKKIHKQTKGMSKTSIKRYPYPKFWKMFVVEAKFYPSTSLLTYCNITKRQLYEEYKKCLSK